jgi:chromosome segregation ATPase
MGELKDNLWTFVVKHGGSWSHKDWLELVKKTKVSASKLGDLLEEQRQEFQDLMKGLPKKLKDLEKLEKKIASSNFIKLKKEFKKKENDLFQEEMKILMAKKELRDILQDHLSIFSNIAEAHSGLKKERTKIKNKDVQLISKEQKLGELEVVLLQKKSMSESRETALQDAISRLETEQRNIERQVNLFNGQKEKLLRHVTILRDQEKNINTSIRTKTLEFNKTLKEMALMHEKRAELRKREDLIERKEERVEFLKKENILRHRKVAQKLAYLHQKELQLQEQKSL